MTLKLVNEVRQLQSAIAQSKHVVALTGAGISVSAGIPDLEHVPIGIGTELSSEAFMIAHPERFYKALHETFLDPIVNNGPTITHQALAKLEQQHKLEGVITTNVDYLHELAGSQNVADVWYSFNVNYCLDCGRVWTLQELLASPVPKCPVCGGLLSPAPSHHHIGQSHDDLVKADTMMAKADLVLVMGSNGYYSHLNNSTGVIQINPKRTGFDQRANLSIRANADDVFEKMM